MQPQGQRPKKFALEHATLLMTAPGTRLDQNQIQELIPHRPPFLWLDEVIELSDKKLRARKYIDPDLDVFQGHYPAFPVLPGVLQCEAAFQAGAVLIACVAPPAEGSVPVVTRLNQVQFRKMVRPGQTLEIDVELTEQLANAFFLKAKVSVEGQVAVRLEFACAAAPQLE
jgi:3-hydroxyacyl-[acyl-carrier-protein] dehydratase